MNNSFDINEDIEKPENSISILNNNTYELNIQPPASILNVFSRLSYKIWYAIAEFVDNSTQSYISHADELNESDKAYKLIVRIKYNTVENSLTITDNAYGMEIDKFRNAILLDSRNGEQEGRNEFGMGLKTAASWFGNIWSVTSTRYGSENQFSATVDIPKLKKEGLNSIQIYRENVSKETHGTTIYIREVTKKITASRTIGKIRELLSCMYRRDINNRNIEIWFNDEPICFKDYPILQNFRGKSWRKPIDFDFEFNGQKYNVTGFVAIMNPGSFTNAGFALFRQNRVIIGGPEVNYKPALIFGQAQSQRSLKLFGELNMDDFPVNQAKDGFIWDDGLEDEFIKKLKINIQEYIDIADLSIKERNKEEEYSTENSKELQRDVEKSIEDMVFNSAKKEEQILQESFEINSSNSICNEKQEYVETVLKSPVEEKTVGTNRSYRIKLNAVDDLEINVKWAIGNKDYWIDCTEENSVINVLINIDHPFFMPYSKEESFKKVLEKLVLAFVVAEQQAKRTADKEGYILASEIRNNINRYLANISED